MRPRAIVLLCILLAGGVAGLLGVRREAPAMPPAPPEPPPVEGARDAGQVAVLRGRIVDVLGEPIAGCEVTCEVAPTTALLDPRRTAHRSVARPTAADGSFELVVANQGESFAVTLRHPDFPAAVAAAALTLTAGTQRDLGAVVLRSGSGMAVAVTSARTGLPIAGARVLLRPALVDALAPAAFARALERQAETDARGIAAFDGLRAGDYALRVESDEHAIVERRVAHPAEDPQVALPPGSVLRGRVVDAAGQPIEGATVLARPLGQDTAGNEARTGPTGDFRIPRLAAGRYLVTADAGRRGALAVPAVELPASAPALLRLPELQTVAGAVRAHGAPAAGVSVELTRLDVGRGNAESWTTITRDDGRFETSGIPPGRFRITAASDAAESLASSEIAVPGAPVELELRPAPRVHGTLRDDDGRAIAGATVTALQPDATTVRFAEFEAEALGAPAPTTTTGADGAFELATPARRLAVRAPGRRLLLTDPVATADATSADAGSVVVPVALAVRGKVCRADGAPAPGARVRLVSDGLAPESAAAGAREALCDHRGWFVLDAASAGCYSIAARDADDSLSGARSEARRVTLPDDARHPIALTLR